MRTELRLLRQVGPYRGLFLLGMGSSFGASVLDGFTVVILIPLLKILFGTAGALAAGGSRLEVFTSWLFGPLISGASRGEAAAILLGCLVAALLLKNALGYASSQIQVAIQEGLVRDLRTRLFEHLLRVDLGYFQRTRGGQLIAGLLADVDQTKTAVTAALARLFENVILIAATLVILSQISLRLTLVTLSAAPLLVLAMQSLLRRLRRHSRARAEERGDITATIAERLGAVKLIRAYGEEAREAQRFRDQADRYRKRVIRTQRFSSLMSPASEIFGGLLVILIIWAATSPSVVGGGQGLSPESVIAFLIAALKLMSPIKAISQYPAVMAVALASAERVFAILDQPPVEGARPGERPARFEREIAFDRVSFGYGSEEAVLEDVSFTLPKGQVLAIVGPSGAGKTTLVELLPRFHDPQSGEIRLDGVPLTRLTRDSVRRLLGVVSQDTVLLNDTVSANIAFGSPGATREDIERAAEAANAAGFIAQLPEGFGTVLGERGTRLSGGQRQRIAIARALLRDPPILVLDEATSALDAESERLVQQAVDRLMRDRTVLVIAHRLATVRGADAILVLDRGRVVGRGTHGELYHGGGLYRRLYDLQFQDAPIEPAGAVEG